MISLEVTHRQEQEPETGETGVEHKVEEEDEEPGLGSPVADGAILGAVTAVLERIPPTPLNRPDGCRAENLIGLHC